eukprot:gene8148-9567_t
MDVITFLIGLFDPPGPWSHPIWGNLHQIRHIPHLKLTKLVDTYGKVFRLWMGSYYTIVISDPKFIRAVWIENFDNFVERPHTAILRIMSRNFKSLVGGDEQIWRHNRSLVNKSFTRTKLQALTNIYERQTNNLVGKFSQYEKSGELLHPRKYIRKFTLNVMMSMLFSEEIPYEEDEGRIGRITRQIDMIFKILNGASSLKAVGWFYILMRKFSGPPKEGLMFFVEDMYNQHKETLDPENPRDLFDQMIIESEMNDNKESMMLVAVDFIAAGTEMTSSAIEWFILFMINNPDIQTRARNELLEAVGADVNQVELSHRNKTPYLVALLKEVLRIKPIASLGLPRAAKESIIINDVYIPKGTQVVMNVYALHHDKDIYPDPETFNPDRFMSGEHSSDNWIPFSTGKRNCVGMSLAKDMIYIVCSNLLLNFNLYSHTGERLDDTDMPGSPLAIRPKEFGLKVESRKKVSARNE